MDKRSDTSRLNGSKGGRPKESRNRKTIEAKVAEELLRGQVLEKIQELINAKFDLALGIYFEKIIKGKMIRVYKKEPDNRAIEDLLTRALGKPKDNSLENIGGEIGKLGNSIRNILST